MKTTVRIMLGAFALAGLGVADGAGAQQPAGSVESLQRALSLDIRGSYSNPLSEFGDNVESDFGFGGGAVFSITSALGIYGGWARDSFGCDHVLCSADAKVHVSGFEVGAKIGIPTAYRTMPWLKAGAVGHTVKFDGDVVDFESDRKWGFQAAFGVDVPLGDVLSVSPSIRYTMLDFDGEDDFFDEPEVRYLSIDVGAHIHFPSN